MSEEEPVAAAAAADTKEEEKEKEEKTETTTTTDEADAAPKEEESSEEKETPPAVAAQPSEDSEDAPLEPTDDDEVAEIERTVSGGTDPSDDEKDEENEATAAATGDQEEQTKEATSSTEDKVEKTTETKKEEEPPTVLIEEEHDESTTATIPHNFPPVDNAARARTHSRLRSYEAKRRAAYDQKLASSSLYWRSFRDLLNVSVEETERAESLVKGQAIANEQYAIAMAACAEDCIDEDGKPVTDGKKKKKLFESRAKKRAGGGTSKMMSLSEATGAMLKAKSSSAASSSSPSEALGVSDLSMEQASERRGSLLSSVIESHSILADRYNEHATFVREEIIPPLFQLCEGLIEEVDTIEKLGDAIMDELTAAEKEVADAWEDYYKAAVKSLGGEGASVTHRKGASSAKEEIVPLEKCKDVWVAEMHYRMSVAFLSACWEKCSTELSKLFSSMKETECTRRFRLREILLTFLERQERLWHSLPSILTPVLKGLADKPMDRTSIENDVQGAIRLRAQNLQREEAEHKKKGGPGAGPGLAGVNPEDGNFELSSPLMSDLLFKAKVIEKKGSGYMSSWKTTLAVVTADSFLHLFDMPSSVKFQSGSAPEVAFHALLPPVVVPTKEAIEKHGHPKITVPKAWCQNLTPSESMALPNCTISFQDEKGNSAFEISETVFNSGAKKTFFITSTRKLYLRTVTREETIDWIAALKARK